MVKPTASNACDVLISVQGKLFINRKKLKQKVVTGIMNQVSNH